MNIIQKLIQYTLLCFILIFMGKNSVFAAETGNTQEIATAVNYYDRELTAPIVPLTVPYTYQQMQYDIQLLANSYGNHMEVRSIGRTWDNRELFDIVVGNPNASKHLLVQGGIHGRESITTLLMMKQLEYILAYYEGGTVDGFLLSDLLDQVAIHFIPMMNPDGVSISQLGENGIQTPELRQILPIIYQFDQVTQKRKSSYSSYLTLWKSNARGVDLNHNFPAGWDMTFSPEHLSSMYYRGPGPFSEPESAALATLLEQYPFKTIINYHAMGEVIYWDVAGNQQKDSSLILASLVSQATGYKLSGELGVGGVKDWVQSKPTSVPSVTLEVGRTACPVPLSQFPVIWMQNRSVVAIGLKFAVMIP